ncbi:MAG: hypothetical protein B7733_01565 [Myxococcales bacterium FL481]|nr:MAG: hypothetical protein B7733_01565 [Myxococcales bacterium FL481]
MRERADRYAPDGLMTIVFVIGGPSFGMPATSAHAVEWADEYGFSTPVLVDPEYETTGYLLPPAVTIPVETLVAPGLVLTDNPAPGLVDDAAIEAVLPPPAGSRG